MQNSNADAYRTVRNADPDADAGSVVRYCAVPHLTTVPVRGWTRRSGLRSRIRVSILKPGTASFFKAKIVKTWTDPSEGRRGSGFLSKKFMFKIFQKLLGVTRTRIRILGSGSVKKNSSKPKNANDSGSGRGPDPRIIPNWMRMHLDPKNQTDNRRKDSYKTFSSFWANSQCKEIFIHSFFCWFVGIMKG